MPGKGKPFEKGNPGRIKGIPNKATVEQKQRIEFVLTKLEESLEKDLQSLEPKEKIKLWYDLQEFIRPKLARKEIIDESKKEHHVVIRPHADH